MFGSVLSYRFTVLPGSAVPLTVSVLSLVILSVALVPVSSPTLFTPGAAGAVVSMVIVTELALTLLLPATSVALALKRWAPSARPVAVVMVHLPWASVMTVPMATPLS